MADGSLGEDSRHRYDAGDVIFRQGDVGEAAYLVETGCVGIYRRYASLSLKLGVVLPGQVFGEMACIDGTLRVASAVCDVPTEVVRIPRHLIEEKVAEADPLLHKVIVQELKYIRGSHDSYARLMQANEMIRVLQSAKDIEEALRLMPNLLSGLFANYCGRLSLFGWNGQEPQVIAWGQGCRPDGEPAFSVPLRAGQERLGLLQLDHRPPEDLNGEQFVVTVAEHIGLTLGNLRLRQKLSYMASRDGLTGLFNRGYAEEWLANEVKLASRRGSTLAIILMDLDYFKAINDSLGHQAGDDVLRAVGRLLTTHQRAGDMVSRFGGEEFLLVLLDCNLADALKKAEKLRRQMETLVVETGEHRLDTITASFGVAIYPAFGASYAEVTKAADEALYRAKEWGRNRVEAAIR